VTALHRLTAATGRAAAHPAAFVSAVGAVGLWLALGPASGWSDTWHVVADAVMTVIGFWLAFLVLVAQSRDTAAVQAKLDELIRATAGARDGMIRAEECDTDEIEARRIGKRDDAARP